MTGAFTLKGRHVLAMLLAFFGLIFAANFVFVTLALRSFPGQEASKPYMQGLRYNDEIARRAAEEALGWTAAIEGVERVGDGLVIRLSLRGRNAAPLLGMVLEGELRRPVHDGDDLTVRFESAGDGAYVGAAPGAAAGLWELRGVATAPEGGSMRFAARLVAP